VVMKEVRRDADIAKFGAREKVEFAYFTTVYALVEYRTSWGNTNGYYQDYGSYKWEIDPNNILSCAGMIPVTPGRSVNLVSEIALVVRGRSHALLIRGDRLFSCEPIKDGRSLTLGSLLKKREFNLDTKHLYATDEMPIPINGLSGDRWELIVGSHGRQGWNHRVAYEDFVIEPDLLILHAYLNFPYSSFTCD
jgi:hypothetical protein